eukprot:EC790303.1.p1 GENE.EC790303.1~~EC790303.1.p1  ORF type:complete len:155 (+),score=14.04 EC790303.1:95-559(+)
MELRDIWCCCGTAGRAGKDTRHNASDQAAAKVTCRYDNHTVAVDSERLICSCGQDCDAGNKCARAYSCCCGLTGLCCQCCMSASDPRCCCCTGVPEPSIVTIDRVKGCHGLYIQVIGTCQVLCCSIAFPVATVRWFAGLCCHCDVVWYKFKGRG